MAKISSEKSGGDALTGLKDLYSQREREAEAKHKSEIGELQKTHRTELERVQSDAHEKVRRLQEETATKLNKRDLQFQKEVEAMRAMYQRRAAEPKKEES